ncbi:pyridoxal-phosphate dependent enzyme [Halomarina oriensis]|uniref:Pyridoxal-phosphate dependent enzyme n=1 Tax=Halomarina oriensis TaxID=671145 RepID=A0A6B0GSW2_9EURY|nr:pyridoxal-phosphate dependent enzyme [Halomarina oriensis]MWG36427.1 pyridoxal-phosphate dependent enzyme [Halomarina oriensis]
METTSAFEGLVCPETDERFDPTTTHHPDGGVLDATYDYDSVTLSREQLESRPTGPAKYGDLLPFPADARAWLGEGGTPLLEAPRLAEELGVGRVLVKDEAQNPTGTVKDRGVGMAVAAAVQHGAEDVALATTGDAGQSMAAHAARAGLNSHSFVPSRSTFVTKAMINVHGGAMKVVEGRLPDARAAFEDALVDGSWYSLEAFATPYRHEGTKTLAYEVLEALDWEAPDGVFYPLDGTAGLVGFHKGAREFRDLGLVDDVPPLYACEAAGCAPVTEAFEAGDPTHDPWEVPDTVCGGLEDPDPRGGRLVQTALRESGGGAVATDDGDILSSAATVASHEGIEMGVSAAAAASGAWSVADRFDEDATLVLVNTSTGNKDADLLRSHLMGQGI